MRGVARPRAGQPGPGARRRRYWAASALALGALAGIAWSPGLATHARSADAFARPSPVQEQGGCPAAASASFPLRVGPTKRHLVGRDGRPFLLVGDAAWSLIAQLSDEEGDTYLANRSRLGFSAVLVNLIEHQFATHAPADIYGFRPFVGRAFTTPNEPYFAHADHLICSAAKLGLVVLLAPDYLGFDCGPQGWCAETRAASEDEMRAWGRYVGSRYRAYDNIVWLIGGDADPTPVSAKLQAMVEGILEADRRHPLTAHNRRGEMAIAPWPHAPWLTVNTIYTDGLEYAYARAAYAVEPARPFFLVEARYEHDEGATSQRLRAEAYWTLLSGGFGVVFGNCPIWSFGTSPGFCRSENWRAELDGPGSQDMTRFGALFASRHWQTLVPDFAHVALVSGYGTFGGDDYATAAYAADSSSLIAYLPSARTVSVDGGRLAGATMRAWWYDPATGVATRAGTWATSGARHFTPPGPGDWVLVVDSRAFDFPAPGSRTASRDAEPRRSRR